jgi:hypothetical protein
MKMEEFFSLESSVSIYQTTRRLIVIDCNIITHLRENLRAHLKQISRVGEREQMVKSI